MVAARRQRQAQKLQEQQISKALTDSKPASNHVSFDDDEDDDADAVPSAPSTSDPKLGEQINASSDNDSEDDDAPIEVVSNETSRKQATQDSARLRAQEKAEKAKRRAAGRKKVEKKNKKEAAQDASEGMTGAKDEEDLAQSSSEARDAASDAEAGPSNRLDPSLFAEVFSRPISTPRSILKRRSADQEADELARLQKERKLKRKKQRAGGVVRGRDGMPMKMTSEGTVLRALNTSSNHRSSFEDPQDTQIEEPLDELKKPTPLDPSLSLPNAKARAFKKRTLSKKGASKASTSTKGSNAKPQKNEDDPLGLNDPAFMPGGEFYHLMNKSAKSKSEKSGRQQEAASARLAFRGGGVRKDAVSVLRARSRGAPSVGFARSQQDSDDD